VILGSWMVSAVPKKGMKRLVPADLMPRPCWIPPSVSRCGQSESLLNQETVSANPLSLKGAEVPHDAYLRIKDCGGHVNFLRAVLFSFRRDLPSHAPISSCGAMGFAAERPAFRHAIGVRAGTSSDGATLRDFKSRTGGLQ
jgi:hypothetical protein